MASPRKKRTDVFAKQMHPVRPIAPAIVVERRSRQARRVKCSLEPMSLLNIDIEILIKLTNSFTYGYWPDSITPISGTYRRRNKPKNPRTDANSQIAAGTGMGAGVNDTPAR